MTVSEGYPRQDNTDVPQGLPILASRPITIIKAKQTPKGEEESAAMRKYTTLLKNLMTWLIHLSRNLGTMCGNGF